MRKFFWIVIGFIVLPTIASVILLKLTIAPLTNFLLKRYIAAPFDFQKIDINWSLTKVLVENFRIFQPPQFGKGTMLSFQKAVLNLQPSTYWKLEPYGTLKVSNLYLHYKKINGISNIAVAFNLPEKSAEDKSNQEFELKQVSINSNFKGLSNINYTVNGYFVGFHNNAQFQIEGSADISKKNNPQVLANFKVYNWILRNKYLKSLTGKDEIKLTKIEGTVKIAGNWIYFVNRNTKAFTINNILFAEIYKNSKYNRLTKELYITGAIYYPIKIEFKITGTSENPKISIKKLTIPNNINLKNLLPAGNTKVIKEQIKKSINQLKNETIKEQVEKPINQLKNKLENNLDSVFKQAEHNLQQIFGK